jgi:hypothetical protein
MPPRNFRELEAILMDTESNIVSLDNHPGNLGRDIRSTMEVGIDALRMRHPEYSFDRVLKWQETPLSNDLYLWLSTTPENR